MTKYTLMLPVAATIGCSPFSNLPEDVHQYIAQQVEYSEAEAAFVNKLAITAKKEAVFNSAGERGRKGFFEDHAQTLEDLEYYFSNDQIVGFYEENYPKRDDSAAFYRDRWFRKEDIIAINLDALEELPQFFNSAAFMHEAGHALINWHPPSLEDVDGVIYDASLAEIVIEEQDYPYLLTLLYEAADRSLDDPHNYASRKLESYRGDVQRNTMTPQEAYDELTLLIKQKKEDWIDRVLKNTYRHIEYTTTFDWSEEEFADALRNSGMFEYRQDVFLDHICDFAAEYPEIDAKECEG